MRKRFNEANDSDVILNSMFELTHGFDGEGESVPTFFNIEEITNNYGLSEKEVIDIAKANGYNVYRIPGGEDLVNFTVIAHEDLSYGDIVKGTEVNIKDIGDDTDDSFNAEESYMNRVDTNDLYRKLKDETNNFTTSDTLSFNSFEEQIEARKILLKHYDSVETFANNYGNHQVYFIDIDEPKKAMKEKYVKDSDMDKLSTDELNRVNREKIANLKVFQDRLEKLVNSWKDVEIEDDEFIAGIKEILNDVQKIDRDSVYGHDLDGFIKGLNDWIDRISGRKYEGLDDMKVASAHHLVKVVDRDKNLITQKLFNSRPQVDRFVDKYNDVLFDMKIDNNETEHLDNGKEFFGKVYTVIIDEKDESLKKDKEQEESLNESNEEVVEETNEYKIVKTIQHNFKTVKGVARKGKDKVIYQVYFRTQDFNPAVNRWMNKGWTNSTSEHDSIESARAYVKKYGKTLKDELEEDIEKHPTQEEVYRGYKIVYHPKYSLWANMKEYYRIFSPKGTLVGGQKTIDGAKAMIDKRIQNKQDMFEEVEDELKPWFMQQGEDGEPEYLGFAKSQDDMIDKMVKSHDSNSIYENTYIEELDKDTYLYMKKEGTIDADDLKELDRYFGIEESLEEDIEKHDELNPKLFDNDELKPEVKDKIVKIADEFVKELNEDNIHFVLKDIVLLGSNVSYNYTKDSDLDIHLIADSSGFECPQELYDKLYGAYRSIFNKNYDIKLKGIPAEIYVELDEPRAKSNGIYSINNGWIKHPEQQAIPNIDRKAFDELFTEWEDRYFDLIGGIKNED